MRITVVAAVGITVAAILAVLLIRYFVNQQNRGSQEGPTQEPSSTE